MLVFSYLSYRYGAVQMGKISFGISSNYNGIRAVAFIILNVHQPWRDFLLLFMKLHMFADDVQNYVGTSHEAEYV